MTSRDEALRFESCPITEAEWDSSLESAPGGGHIYQSYAWGEFKRRHGWRPLRVRLLQGQEAVACGQFLVRGLGPLGLLGYCPKGPWIDWDRPDHVRAFFKELGHLLTAQGVMLLRIEPEVLETRRDIQRLLADLGFFEGRWNQQFKTTMMVDLTPPEDRLLGAMKAQTRRNIRLAARHGIIVEENSSLATREEFFRLFEATSRRDGFFMRPRRYIMDGWEALLRSGRGHVYVARHDGEMLAAMFACTFGQKFWYKDGASSSAHRNYMPTYGLQWEVMRAMKARGITTYDMVAIPDPDRLDDPTDSMHGLYRFKSGFGGSVTEFMRERVRWYRPRTGRLWYILEPITYRIYKRLLKDVYY